MDERRKENPKRKVELWAFDEHRVGLKPILRRQWAPKRQRPIALGQHRFEWLYLYGFVHPSSGAVVWFVCTTVDTDLLSVVLAAFA
ncbi:MAG TPA: IS630 family transposase, partial [Solirubrobacterales bacterium]|nr:IS630 family transposase [Solirubrobacterales bacterium]